MNNLIGYAIVRVINLLPMGGYGTYIVNIGFALAWGVVAFVTGEWEFAFGFIAQFMSNIFMRRSNHAQSEQMRNLEAMLQDISTQVLANRQPTGPEADTRVRDQ